MLYYNLLIISSENFKIEKILNIQKYDFHRQYFLHWKAENTLP